MPEDIYYPTVTKPKQCTYVVQVRKPTEWSEPVSYQQEDILRNLYIFDEFEAALFTLDQLTKFRGHAIPVDWEYVIRRVEKNKYENPQDVVLVSWTRLPDKEGQRPGVANGELTLMSTLNCV